MFPLRFLLILSVLLGFSMPERAQAQFSSLSPARVSIGREMSFDPIFSGQQGGGARRGNLIIHNAKEWQRVFKVAVSGLKFKPALPEIDFSKQMIVAILLGDQLAIDRGVKIRRVVETTAKPRQMVVEYESTPGSTHDASGMTVTSTSQPFFFIAIPQTTLPVRFADFTSPELARAMASTELPFAGDPSGQRTGDLDDLSTAKHTATQEDKAAIVKGGEAGLRLLGEASGQTRVALNLSWILAAALLVFGGQIGLGMRSRSNLGLEVTPKSREREAVLGFLTPILALVAFGTIGFALMWGAVGPIASLGGTAPLADITRRFTLPGLGSVFATQGFFLSGENYDVGAGALWVFQAALAALAVSIAFRSSLHRLKFRALAAGVLVFTAVIYPLAGHWAWGGGWLAQLGQSKGWGLGCGFVDYSGAGIIHLLAAVWAFVTLRTLKAAPNKSSRTEIAATSLLQGSLVLGLGLIGAAMGRLDGPAGAGGLRAGLILSAMLGAGTGGTLSTLLYHFVTSRRLALLPLANGFIAGMISASAAAAFISPAVSFGIGAIGGLIVCLLSAQLDSMRLDDPFQVVAIHGGAGLWSLLALGLFADGTYGAGWNGTFINSQPIPLVGILYGGMAQFVAQIVGILAILLWGFGSAWGFYGAAAKVFHGLSLATEIETPVVVTPAVEAPAEMPKPNRVAEPAPKAQEWPVPAPRTPKSNDPFREPLMTLPRSGQEE